MAKSGSEEGRLKEMAEEEAAHPYAFHVSGPRNVSSPNWRDLISSSWKDGNYKRTVMACFIQAVYLLELDRQENRNQDNALAPKWWTPFKYKLIESLIDERDNSIFGAIFEWDRSSAMADLVLIRPTGAPRAVLALRGTLLKSPTIRRDIEDDLRFLAWESLKGSVRFNVAMEALKLSAEKYGSCNICIAGHSLGAGFALQVGKALAKDGIYVETHLFNPPSVSLAVSLRNIGEKAEFAWKRLKSMLPRDDKEKGDDNIAGSKSWIPNNLGWLKSSGIGLEKWAPHLYVNNSDYICCSYSDRDRTEESIAGKENVRPGNGQVGTGKLFVMSKGKQRFLEAHGLEQWWSDDVELQLSSLHNSKLISRQLKSLYSLPSSQQTQANTR